MDVHYFLIKRLNFVRQFYVTASMPYLERKRKIEAEEEPFVPPYSEDGEPAFLEEWLEADESLHVLAYSCISMLAAALHLYFKAWVKESGVPTDEQQFKRVKGKQGWLAAYMKHFLQRFNINIGGTSINLRLFKEVVLARNLVEHPESITSLRPHFSGDDLRKLKHPFFVDEREAELLAHAEEGERAWFIPPTLHVTHAQLLDVTSEIERFAEWFEAEIERRLYAH